MRSQFLATRRRGFPVDVEARSRRVKTRATVAAGPARAANRTAVPSAGRLKESTRRNARQRRNYERREYAPWFPSSHRPQARKFNERTPIHLKSGPVSNRSHPRLGVCRWVVRKMLQVGRSREGGAYPERPIAGKDSERFSRPCRLPSATGRQAHVAQWGEKACNVACNWRINMNESKTYGLTRKNELHRDSTGTGPRARRHLWRRVSRYAINGIPFESISVEFRSDHLKEKSAREERLNCPQGRRRAYRWTKRKLSHFFNRMPLRSGQRVLSRKGLTDKLTKYSISRSKPINGNWGREYSRLRPLFSEPAFVSCEGIFRKHVGGARQNNVGSSKVGRRRSSRAIRPWMRAHYFSEEVVEMGHISYLQRKVRKEGERVSTQL